MKRVNWLALSITVNLLLAAVVIVVATHTPSQRLPSTLPTRTVAASDAIESNRMQASVAPVKPPARRVGGPEWQQWLDALRAAGVSEKVLAGLVSSDFEQRWQAHVRDMERQYRLGEIDSDTMMRFHQDHDVEQEKEMRAALGDEGFRRWDKQRIFSEFDAARLKLSDSEGDSLYDLRKGFDRLWREIDKTRQNGEIDDVDFEEKMEGKRTEYEQEVKKLIGEDRFAIMQGGGEENMGDLRRNLRSINAGDNVVSQMTDAQRQWAEQRAKLEREIQQGKIAGPEFDEKIKALDAIREQEYQRVLGTNGYAEFQRNQDNRYQMMKRYASAWQLSDSDIDSLYKTIQYYENSIRDYRQRARAAEESGQAVDWPAVQSALKTFSQQTDAEIEKSLGPDRFRKMKRNSVFSADDDIGEPPPAPVTQVSPAPADSP